MMVKCPRCGLSISNNIKRCIGCGYPTEKIPVDPEIAGEFQTLNQELTAREPEEKKSESDTGLDGFRMIQPESSEDPGPVSYMELEGFYITKPENGTQRIETVEEDTDKDKEAEVKKKKQRILIFAGCGFIVLIVAILVVLVIQKIRSDNSVASEAVEELSATGASAEQEPDGEVLADEATKGETAKEESVTDADNADKTTADKSAAAKTTTDKSATDKDSVKKGSTNKGGERDEVSANTASAGDDSEETEEAEDSENSENSAEDTKIEEYKTRLEETITNNFDTDGYNIDITKKDRIVNLYIWGGDFATENFVDKDSGEYTEGFEQMRSSMTDFSEDFNSEFDKIGLKDWHLSIFVLNDQNKERTLLMIVDGIVTFDASVEDENGNSQDQE